MDGFFKRHGYREQKKMVILAFLQSGTVHTFARLKKRPRGFDMEYAVMGGAAVSLVGDDPTRTFEDADIVIHAKDPKITAE